MSITKNLDGNGLTRGQGQEGNNMGLIEYYDWLRKHHFPMYAPYCTDQELHLLWLDEHEYIHESGSIRNRNFNTTTELMEFRDKVAKIYDKMPQYEILQAMEERLRISRAKRNKSHAQHELGAREFTLTYSPKWMDDATARQEMIKAIEKLCKYYDEEILQLRAVGETGSNGLSHIHCFYKLRAGLKITDKNFKRAWKYWNPKKKQGFGFEGGHHQNVRVESDFLGYIDKEIEGAWYEKTARPVVYG